MIVSFLVPGLTFGIGSVPGIGEMIVSKHWPLNEIYLRVTNGALCISNSGTSLNRGVKSKAKLAKFV
jgi:hypothetical protein